jgi:hypothetical protein
LAVDVDVEIRGDRAEAGERAGGGAEHVA